MAYCRREFQTVNLLFYMNLFSPSISYTLTKLTSLKLMTDTEGRNKKKGNLNYPIF